MPRFILTGALQLQGPSNVRTIVNQINSQLQGISANININVNNQALNNANRTIRQTSRSVRTLTSDMERFGAQAAQAIRRYGAFTLATGAFIKLTQSISAGIDDAIKFDREMVRIAQVTGQSVGSLKNLSDEVTRLATSFGVSSENILESAVTLSQAGLSADQTRIALEALAKTGVSATFGDIKETTEASIAAMQQFGYQAQDLEGILGSINSVSAAFAVESEDIAVAIRRAGGAFQAAGGNLNEFQALFTSVRQTTRESAESIATGFRTIFARLQRVRTQNFLKNLGIDVLNEQGLFVGPFEAIRKISTALKDLQGTDPRFAQVIEELGGFRQVSKVIPLIEKFDVAQKALNIAQRGSNSLSRDAAIAQESLAVQITKVREEFTALIREISDNQTFKSLISLTLNLSSAFIKVADSLAPLLPMIATLSAVKIGSNFGQFARGFGANIRGFNSGGFVPGSGNGDTVPAMLTPGEFVINKSAAQAFGYGNLSKINKYADGGRVNVNLSRIAALRKKQGTNGRLKSTKLNATELNDATGQDGNIYDFGMVVLSPVASRQDVTATLNNSKIKGLNGSATANIHVRGLKKSVAGKMEETLLNGVKTSIDTSARLIASDPLQLDLKKIPIDSIIGSLFEGVLLSAGAPFGPEGTSNRALDFPLGVGKNLASIFEPAGTINGKDFATLPTDAKRGNNPGSLGSMFDKAVRYILNNERNKAKKDLPTQLAGLKEPTQDNSQIVADYLNSLPQGQQVKKTDLEKAIKARVGKGVDIRSIINQIGRDETKFANARNYITRKNTGGHIGGTGNSDTIPALLTPGEFVINKQSAQRIGYSTLSMLNRGRGVNRFNKGGIARFAAGGRVDTAVNNIGSVGFAVTAISTFVQTLSGANTEIGQLTSTLATLGGQIALTSTLYKEGARTVGPFLERFDSQFGRNATRANTQARGFADNLRNQSRVDNDLLADSIARFKAYRPGNTRTFQQIKDDELEKLVAAGEPERQEQAEALRESRLRRSNNRTRARNARFANRLAVGGAIVGTLGSFGGGLLQDSARENLNRGQDDSRKFALGGAISGAATGAGIGAAFGIPGVVIGGVIGALTGLTSAFSEAEKTLRGVALDKGLEKLGKSINRLTTGTASALDIAPEINKLVLEQFKNITNTSGTEQSDAIAKFKNQASGIEDFYINIAKGSRSLAEFNSKTGDTLDEFAAISDVNFKDLREQVVKTIEAENKAREAANRFTVAMRDSSNLRVVLDSFSTALVSASDKLGEFDTTLDRIEGSAEFRGGAFKAADIAEMFKAAGGGGFINGAQLSRTSSNLLSPFGSAGSDFAKQISEIANARQLVPALINQFKNSPLRGEEAAPQDFIREALKDAGISDAIAASVVGGIDKVIGGEAKPSRLIEKFQADPTGTVADIFDSLKDFDDEMAQFAAMTSEHNNRVAKLFEVSAKIQTKVNELELQKIDNIIALDDKILESQGRTLSRAGGRARDNAITSQIAGTNQIGVRQLVQRALSSQQNVSRLDASIANRQREGLGIQEELKARQDSIKAYEDSTAALKKLAESGYEAAAIEARLGEAAEGRRARRDFLTTQTFGSKDEKNELAKVLAAINLLAKNQINIGNIRDEVKQGVLSFLNQNSKVRFGGLGGATGEQVLKVIIVQDQSRRLQAQGVAAPVANATAQNAVNQAFNGTKEEENLRKELAALTARQNEALTGLQQILDSQDPLKTNLLAQENSRFLTELNNIFTSTLIQQEQLRLNDSQAIIDRATKDSQLPSIENLNAAKANLTNNKKIDELEAERKADIAKIESDFQKELQTKGSISKEFAASRGISTDDFDAIRSQVFKENPTNLGSSKDLVAGLRANQKEISNRIQSLIISGIEDRSIAAQNGLRANLVPSDNNPANKFTQAQLDDAIARRQALPTPQDVARARGQVSSSSSFIKNLQEGRNSFNTAQQRQIEEARKRSEADDAARAAQRRALPNVPVDANRPIDERGNTAYNNSVDRMSNTVNQLNQFATRFEKTVSGLNGLQVEITGQQRLEVVFNGAEVLAKLQPELEQLAINSTKKQINKFIDEKLPGVGRIA